MTEYKIVLSQSYLPKLDGQNWVTEINNVKIKKGSSFWNVEEDLLPIYMNFNLLSYFSSSCHVSILDRDNSLKNSNYLSADLFKFKKSQNKHLMLLKERQKQNLSILKSGTLLYEVRQLKDTELSKKISLINSLEFLKTQKIAQIQIKFSTEIIDLEQEVLHYKNKKIVKQKSSQFIWIKVIDKDGWIFKNFNNIEFIQYRPRISVSLKSKSNQVEYFYREPKSQRYKKFKQEHLSLALQGGGCKGVQYIGAYQAILQNKNIPIKSIIGSSAGSIIGLAICCGLQPEQIIEICTTTLSKVTTDQKYKNVPLKDSSMSKHFQIILDTLRDLNIFEDKILQIMERILPDPQFQRKLLEIIGLAVNSEIFKLFRDQKNQLNLQGLINAELMTGNIIARIGANCIQKLLNRLLDKHDQKIMKKYGYLRSVQSYFQRDSKMMEVAMNFTMKELYQLTGIEFTCTTVDITNHILRFLNQKTTPDLPVCKAVQMSGSFPVAFEAQKWDKSWGKYYIHYHSIRKQIDLTGCMLTDGGTLANFPMKYLDNEDMRPMYFSHVKTKETLMYGFGLKTEIKLSEEQKKQKLKLAQKSKQLAEFVMSKIGKCMPICQWLKSKLGCSKPKKKTIQNIELHLKKISSIPLIDFVLKLFQTYSLSRDNLTQQCYSHRTFESQISECYRKQLQNKPNDEYYSTKIRELTKKIQQLLVVQAESIEQIFQNNIKYVKKLCQQRLFQQLKLYQAADIIVNNFTLFLKTLFQYLPFSQKQQVLQELKKLIKSKIFPKIQQIDQQKIISKMFQQIQSMKKQRTFILSGIQEDFSFLNKVTQIFYTFYLKIKNRKILRDTLLKIHEEEVKNVQSIKNLLKKSLISGETKRLKSSNIAVALQLRKIFNITSTHDLKTIKTIINLIKNCEIPELFVFFQTYQFKNTLESYVTRGIMGYSKKERIDGKQQPAKFQGLHIVFESIYLSQMYFHEYFLIVKELLLRYNSDMKQRIKNFQQVKVSTITSTGYHSIAMFLHASDLSENRISQQILNIRDLITIDLQKLVRDFQKGDWAKVTPLLLKQIQTQAIKNRKDIFDYIQKDMNNDQTGNQVQQKSQNEKDSNKIQSNTQMFSDKIKSSTSQRHFNYIQNFNDQKNDNKAENLRFSLNFGQFKNQKNSWDKIDNIKKSIQKNLQKVQEQNEIMIEAIESSLNHVVSLLADLEDIQKQERVNQLLTQKLMYSKQHMIKSDHFEGYSKRLKKICNYFFKKYKDIFQHIIYHYPLKADQIYKLLKPQQRKQVWKIVLLSQIVSGKNIKNYIKDILKDLKLGPNTTLKQFYDYSSKKIQINFSVINEEVVSILNHKTRPNMPVWAAIMAGTSTPQFFLPVLDRPEWRIRQQQKDFAKKKVQSYFETSKRSWKFITSSQLLTRMPLDLLTNNKYQSLITEKIHEVFIVFNFQPDNILLQRLKLDKKCTVSPITLGQLITKFVSFRSIISKMICGSSNKSVQNSSQQQKNIFSFSLLKNIPFFEEKMGLLKQFVDNHDNLMCKLYKRQIILLPVRFSTLDFHKMNKMLPNTQQVLSDVCEDAIMQAKYIVLQKMQNRYYNNDLKLQKIKNQGTNKLNQFSRNRQIQIQFKQNRKMFIRVQSFIDHQQPKKQLQFQSSSFLNLNGNRSQIKDAKLKLRFLSFLNPSRELFEKYHIYYSKIHSQDSYIKLSSQSIILNTSYKEMYLKIEYPSSDLTQINTSYFKLDFKELFELFNISYYSESSEVMIEYRNKSIKNLDRFGYVYPMIFDQIYDGERGVRVKPQGKYQQDYMNKQNPYIKQPHIYIKSELRNTKKQQFFCNKCIKHLHKDHNFSNKTVFKCEQCQQDHEINKYYIHFDNQTGNLSCMEGHMLMRKKFDFGCFDSMNLTNFICDICGNGGFKEVWKDQICKLTLCDKCTRESFLIEFHQ